MRDSPPFCNARTGETAQPGNAGVSPSISAHVANTGTHGDINGPMAIVIGDFPPREHHCRALLERSRRDKCPRLFEWACMMNFLSRGCLKAVTAARKEYVTYSTQFSHRSQSSKIVVAWDRSAGQPEKGAVSNWLFHISSECDQDRTLAIPSQT